MLAAGALLPVLFYHRRSVLSRSDLSPILGLGAPLTEITCTVLGSQRWWPFGILEKVSNQN